MFLIVNDSGQFPISTDAVKYEGESSVSELDGGGDVSALTKDI